MSEAGLAAVSILRTEIDLLSVLQSIVAIGVFNPVGSRGRRSPLCAGTRRNVSA